MSLNDADGLREGARTAMAVEEVHIVMAMEDPDRILPGLFTAEEIPAVTGILRADEDIVSISVQDIKVLRINLCQMLFTEHLPVLPSQTMRRAPLR